MKTEFWLEGYESKGIGEYFDDLEAVTDYIVYFKVTNDRNLESMTTLKVTTGELGKVMFYVCKVTITPAFVFI